jgi:hypothetical protein
MTLSTAVIASWPERVESPRRRAMRTATPPRMKNDTATVRRELPAEKNAATGRLIVTPMRTPLRTNAGNARISMAKVSGPSPMVLPIAR